MNPWETYYSNDHPLFRVGRVPVYVTTLFVALQVVALTLFAFAGYSAPFVSNFVFSVDAVASGRLWTLITYVFVDILSFWTALGLVFFYLFGRPVESRLGTRRFLYLLAVLILGPTLFLTLWGLIPGLPSMAGSGPGGKTVLGGLAGYASSMNVRLAVLIAFVWFNSHALFWPGVQAKWFGIFFVALQTLQLLAFREWTYFWMCWLSLLLAYVTLRRMGLTMQFPSLEEPLLRRLAPTPQQRAYRNSQRKLKLVKSGKTARRHRYEPKLAPKVEPPVSKTAVASVDHLLEKISREGISSLTDAERKQLENASNQLSDRENPFSS